MKKTALDATDIRILNALQKSGPLSKAKLAEAVNLSATPCWARLDKLKKAGLIRGYRAEIAIELIADVTQVVMTVALKNHRKEDFERFEAAIIASDDVIDCIATGGGMDYVLKVVTPNLSDFQILMDQLLSSDLGIERYMTYIVTRHIKSTNPNLTRLIPPTRS